MAASYAGHIRIVQRLVNEGADLNMEDEYGLTALMCVALKGQDQAVQLLLENDADVNAQDNASETALMWASEQGQAQLIQLLLDNLQTESGLTALMFADYADHVHVAQMLKDKFIH